MIDSLIKQEFPGENSVYAPEVTEQEKLKTLKGYLDSAKQTRLVKTLVFQKAEEFIRGKQWETVRPEHLSNYSSNMMYSTMRSKIAILTDNNPIFKVYPTSNTAQVIADEAAKNIQPQSGFLSLVPDQQDQQPNNIAPNPQQQPQQDEQGTLDAINSMVDRLNVLLNDYGWNHWKLVDVITEAAWDAFIFGTGIVKICYNPDEDFGKGDVECYSIHPSDFFVSADCQQNLQKAHYTIEQRVYRMEEIMIKFPDKAIYVKPDGSRSIQAEVADVDYTGIAIGQTYTNVKQNEMVIKDNSGKDYLIKNVTVYEMYERCMDTDSYNSPQIGEDGTPVVQNGSVQEETIVKLKYPKGRHVVWTDSCILKDEENEYSSGKFPYFVFRENGFPRSFWGMGEYECYHNTQRAYNRIVCNLIDWSNGAHSKHLVKNGALVNTKKIKDEPYQTLELTDIGDYKMSAAPEPPSGLFTLLSILDQGYKMESGIHDVTQGNKQAGLDRVGVAMTIKQSDFTAMRPLIRDFEEFIADIGEMCICIMLQYNRFQRLYAFPDSQGKLQLLNIPAVPEDVDLYFKVRVQANTMLPQDESSNAAMALQLFKMQVIGQQTLLKAVKFPNIQEALQETNQLQTLMQQVQSLSQQLQQYQKALDETQTHMEKLQRVSDNAEGRALHAEVGQKLSEIKHHTSNAEQERIHAASANIINLQHALDKAKQEMLMKSLTQNSTNPDAQATGSQ